MFQFFHLAKYFIPNKSEVWSLNSWKPLLRMKTLLCWDLGLDKNQLKTAKDNFLNTFTWHHPWSIRIQITTKTKVWHQCLKIFPARNHQLVMFITVRIGWRRYLFSGGHFVPTILPTNIYKLCRSNENEIHNRQSVIHNIRNIQIFYLWIQVKTFYEILLHH